MRILALLLLAVPAAAQSLEVVGAYKAQGKVSTEIISVQGPTKRAVVSLRMHGVELLDLADPANPKLIVRHALIAQVARAGVAQLVRSDRRRNLGALTDRGEQASRVARMDRRARGAGKHE